MRALGHDVTQVAVDERGTISPPSAAGQRGEPLPRLRLRQGAGGPGGTLRIGAVLGEGGMGVVSAAFDEALRREVAVKRPSADGGHAELVREARVTGGLAHANIVPVYALGDDDSGAPVMVMKRIEGRLWCDVVDAEEGGGVAPRLRLDRDQLRPGAGGAVVAPGRRRAVVLRGPRLRLRVDGAGVAARGGAAAGLSARGVKAAPAGAARRRFG
jgi:hypothetical protein